MQLAGHGHQKGYRLALYGVGRFHGEPGAAGKDLEDWQLEFRGLCDFVRGPLVDIFGIAPLCKLEIWQLAVFCAATAVHCAIPVPQTTISEIK